MWYLALLTIFDLIAVVLFPPNVQRQATLTDVLRLKRRVWVPVAWAITILGSFAVRQVYPVGTIFVPLGLQIAYLPQYILAYFAGHAAALTGNPFVLSFLSYDKNSVTKLLGTLTLVTFSLGLIFLVPPAGEDHIQLCRGGFNLPALIYAIWNEVGFATIGPALLAVFMKHLSFPLYLRSLRLKKDRSETGGGVFLARYSYTAFLLHPLVSIAVELVIESLMNCKGEPDPHGLWSLMGPVVLALAVGAVNILAT